MTSRIRSRVTAVVAVATIAFGNTACKDFLDVNKNPNSPDHTESNNYLPQMLYFMATSEQNDGRFIGRMAQEIVAPPTTIGNTPGNWERMGYDPTSDNGASE